jgi:hypothetical protein
MVWRCVVGDIVIGDGSSSIAIDGVIIGGGRGKSGAATRDGDIIYIYIYIYRRQQ